MTVHYSLDCESFWPYYLIVSNLPGDLDHKLHSYFKSKTRRDTMVPKSII